MKTGREYRAIGVGIALGLVLSVLNLVLFGGGHGTYVPALICFGPAFVAGVLLQNAFIALLSGPVLYGVYAALLKICRARGRGLSGLLALMIFHNAFVVWHASEYEFGRMMRWVLNGSEGAGLILFCAAIYFFAVGLAIYSTLRMPKPTSQ
jgi:hypothetical protein